MLRDEWAPKQRLKKYQNDFSFSVNFDIPSVDICYLEHGPNTPKYREKIKGLLN